MLYLKMEWMTVKEKKERNRERKGSVKLKKEERRGRKTERKGEMERMEIKGKASRRGEKNKENSINNNDTNKMVMATPTKQ